MKVSTGQVIVFICIAVLIMCCIAGCRPNSNGSDYVLIGPVYPKKGIPGIAEKNMTRKQIISILGVPLRERDDYRVTFDPDLTDYMPGIYAQLDWDNKDRLMNLHFDLKKFRKEHGVDLRVYVYDGKHGFLFTDQLALKEASSLQFGKGFAITERKIVDNSLYYYWSKDDDMVLYFDPESKKLSTISIGFWHSQ